MGDDGGGLELGHKLERPIELMKAIPCPIHNSEYLARLFYNYSSTPPKL